MIPDFDLSPSPDTSKPRDKTTPVESTLKKPESVNKRRRNRFKTKRKKASPQNKIRTITLKASTAKPKTKSLLGEFVRARQVSKTSTTSRPVNRITPANRNTLELSTTPTTLASFDSLQQTVQHAFIPVKFSTHFRTSTSDRITTNTTPTVVHTTNRPKHLNKGRKSKKQTQPRTFSTFAALPTPTTQRYQNKECPESLQKCVDSCVPLEVIVSVRPLTFLQDIIIRTSTPTAHVWWSAGRGARWF